MSGKFIINHTDRVKAQTVDEWLQEYNTGKIVMPAALIGSLVTNTSTELPTKVNGSPRGTTQQPSEPRLKYIGHRTIPVYEKSSERHKTAQASLILEFANISTGEEVVAFFNVSVKRLRGKAKGTTYRLGPGGQFNPGPRSKFCKFWQQVIGQAPRRWSRVHHELHKLKDHIYSAELETVRRSDSVYMKASNLRKILHSGCTKIAQPLHSESTANLHSILPETLSSKGF